MIKVQVRSSNGDGVEFSRRIGFFVDGTAASANDPSTTPPRQALLRSSDPEQNEGDGTDTDIVPGGGRGRS